MSQAEELLNGLSGGEASTRTAESSTEPHIVVNADRTITVPDELKHIAVQFDHNIETVTFDCPRHWDEHDFSKMKVYVVYRRHDGYVDRYPAKNLRVDDSDTTMIHFDWTISKNVTPVKGNISFIVCINAVDDEAVETNHWNSRLNQDLIVDEGLECSNDEIVEHNPDVIEDILVRLNVLEQGSGSGGLTEITKDNLPSNVPFIENAFAGGYVYVAGADDNGNPTAWGLGVISTGGNVSSPAHGLKYLYYSKQTLTEEDKAQARENIGAAKAVDIEPLEEDTPKVFIDGSAFKDMTIEKNEVEMTMEYISKTERFTAAIKIKYQGATSLYFDKKNFTIKMYTDDTYENKLKKVFKDWGVEQNKYVLKANYIDHSHARNIVCARLWDEVVSSRADYDTLPVEMRNSPKNGAVDGFPVKLYINGTYQGIYTWNIGKDDWMWGMDEDNQNHVLLCGETNTNGVYTETPCNFRALWSGVDEEHWTVEVGTNSDAVKNSLNALISCVKDTDDETFKATIGNYLDVQSAIDYYIHQYVINNGDGLARNMLLATFDGTKWICGAYDMDGTIGINGSESIVYSARPCPEEYAEQYSLLWYRIENLFTEELKARYFELRGTVYCVANMINHFERFMDVIPLNLYEEDVEIHPGIPCAETNNIQQIRNSIRDRLAYCDVEFKKMGEDPDLMYRLETETTFDGVDDYINTGLTPFSEAQDFTILMDVDPSQNTAAANLIAVRDAFNITVDGEPPTSLTPYDSAYGWPFQNNKIQTDGQRTKVALVFSGGIASAMYWKTENGSMISTSANGTFKSAITNNPLYIGSYYGSGGEPALPWKGTVYSFEFWSRAMTAEEIAEKFEDAPQKELLYELPEATVFDGSSVYIDTGVKLFDTAKDFTIFMDLDGVVPPAGSYGALLNAGSAAHIDNNNLWLGYREGTNLLSFSTSGISTQIWEDVDDGWWGHSWDNVHRIALVYVGGVFSFGKYLKKTGVELDRARYIRPADGVVYSPSEETLTLGSMPIDWTQRMWWTGTVNECRVYNRAMTEEEVIAMVQGD